MDKNKEIKFVGQPIFKQIVSLIDAFSISSLVKKHNADHYYKACKAKTQLKAYVKLCITSSKK